MSEHTSDILLQKRETLISNFLTDGVPSFSEKLTFLFDDYFCRSYEKSLIGPKMNMPKNPYAIVALGGYGRKEQCIHSDVDLLFLFKSKLPGKAADLVKEFAYPLWDKGFEVGHATRTVKECIGMAGDDIEVLMSLMDGRFVCGISSLFFDMREGLRKKIVRFRTRKIISMLVEDSFRRHRRCGDSSYLLEPNIKEGQGGLRDFHTMLWAARLHYDTDRVENFRHPNGLVAREFQSARDTATFLRNVRNRLHFIARRKCDRLYLEHQMRLAELMKFEKQDGQEPVERFLGDLHDKMDQLKRHHHTFFLELGYIKAFKEGRRILKKQTAVKGLAVDKNNMLAFASRKAIHHAPELLIDIFAESMKLGIPLSASAKENITDLLYLVDEDYRKKPSILKTFELLLTTTSATVNALDDMLATGFLVAFIPEMKGIVNRIQYNEYHLYPVDKHSIKAATAVKSFGMSSDPESFCFDIYKDIDDKRPLLWACLLHDIGKSGTTAHHEDAGAEIAGRILNQKGYGRAIVETVQFLVKRHLYLMQIATRRDIHEEVTAISCAREIKRVEMLNMLYLLTVADAVSTGPKAWNDWSSTLLRELFLKIRNILKHGELASTESVQKVEKKKQDLRIQLSDTHKQPDVERLIDILSPRYLLYVNTTDIRSHLHLFSQLNDAEFVWSIKKDDTSNTRVVSVCAKNRPGLFSKIAGVLALSDIDVLDAQVYTWKNNMALDIFRVTPPKDQLFEVEKWNRIHARLRDAIRYDVNLSVRMNQKIKDSTVDMPHNLDNAQYVRIDNESSDFFTIIEVCTFNVPGLLFHITDMLYRVGLDIYVAKIATKVDQVMDVFYVRNLYGEKVNTGQQAAEIKSAVGNVLPVSGAIPNNPAISGSSNSGTPAFAGSARWPQGTTGMGTEIEH